MAVNIGKLLPSASQATQGGALLKTSQKVIGGKSSRLVEDLGIIKVTVIEVDSILKGTLALKKKQLDQQKRLESSKRREKQEEKLETKPQAEKGGIKVPSLPKMGFFDWIKNFIGNIILGYFAVRMVDYLPKLVPIVKFLGTATDFVLGVGGKLLDGLVTFVDWGYKAYDKTNEFLKNLGGENFSKIFEGFSGALGTLIETAIIATTVIASQGKGGVLDVGLDMLTDIGTQRGAQAATQAGVQATGQTGGTVAQAGGLGAGAVAGIVAGAGLLASALGEGAFQLRKIAIKPIQDAQSAYDKEKNPFIKIGRGAFLAGMNMLLGPIKGIGLMLDIIGAPFRYAIELLRYPFLSEDDKKKQAFNLAKLDSRIREDFRKGLNFLTLGFAFKEKGSFGNIYGNKGAQKEMMGKMQGGGIMRGGKKTGGPKRAIGGTKKKGKYKRALAPKRPGKVEITSPGADVGGEEKLFGIFPKPKLPDVVNPFRVVKETGDELGKTDYFGPILAISSKITAGQLPTQQDYQNAGIGINLLIAEGIREQQLKGGLVAAFAEGGLVDPDVLSAVETGGDVSNWVAKTFKGEIESNAQKTLRMIRENAGKKQPSGAGPGAQGETTSPGVNIQGGDADFWTLVAIASREDGDPQGWADVAQSIYNRKGSGAYGSRSIKEIITSDMQYEPTWQYPKPGTKGKANQEWLAIQDLATASAASGQSQDALKKVAAALLDTNLQKNARDFVQGRIDFRGYGVSGGIQRKSGDNYFGWYNNYKENKIAAVPNFGATVTSSGDIQLTGPSDKGGLGGSLTQYITGDPNTPFGTFDRGGHGMPSNYHDHLAFKDKETTQRAFNFFKSKGFQVTELNVSDGHNPGSLHYVGRAFDIPGAQWGGSGAIGQTEYRGSAKVREALKQFLGGSIKPMSLGGKVSRPTRALIGEKGPEFVIDADSTKALEQNYPGFLNALNKANYEGALNVLRNYTEYERSEPKIVYVPVPIEKPVSMGNYGGSGMPMTMPMSGSSGEDPYEALYAIG